MSKTFFRKKGLTENAAIAASTRGETRSPGGRSGNYSRDLQSSKTDRSTGYSGDEPERRHVPLTDGAKALENGDGVERHATIFDDTEVCALLGLRKREIVKRRTEERRGVDWDCVGWHAGMTAAWIRSWNRTADVRRLKPVEPGDGIVTVRVVGRVVNGDVVRAVRVTDGTCVTVRGIRNAWYLHAGDEMDCRMIGGMLTFDHALNRERY